jgi:hypothetical protein
MQFTVSITIRKSTPQVVAHVFNMRSAAADMAPHVKNVRHKRKLAATDHSIVKGSTSTVYSTPEGGF